MMKFTVLMVLLAVAAVQSKKYYGGCVGSLCGGGLAYGGVVAAAPAVAVAAPVAVAAAPAVAVGYGGLGYGYGLGGGCIDTLSGCGGYVGLGYCNQAYYSTGCCNSCALYKKKK